MTSSLPDPPGPRPPAAGVTAVGQYRLLARVGEGGMGVVHLAVGDDGEQVALKVLRPHIVGDDEARARLAREVGSLGRVRSRWVSEILDADPWGEVPFVATRYVPGLSLHDHVAQEGPITGRDLLWSAGCLAEGLAAVHAAGVLHRDVKPSNVLLEGRTPILIDFGLARVADDLRLTHTGWLLGTPGYLAPEILYGDDATTASDVHSWAATVAYAATGVPPFGRGPAIAVMDRVRRGEHDVTAVPEPLRGVLDAALDPEPLRRPSLTEILAWLRPVSTRPHDPPVPPPTGSPTSPRPVVAPATPGPGAPPTRALTVVRPPRAPRPGAALPAHGLRDGTAQGLGGPADHHRADHDAGDRGGACEALTEVSVPVSAPAAPLLRSARPPGPPWFGDARSDQAAPGRDGEPGPGPDDGHGDHDDQADGEDADPSPSGVWEPWVSSAPTAVQRGRAATLTLLLGVLVAAVVAFAPWVGVVLVLLVVWVLRSGSLAAGALAERRARRGRRWHDRPRVLLAAPFSLLRGIPGTLLLALVGLPAGTGAALVAQGLLGDPAAALGVGGATLAGVAWWGPTGPRLRAPVGRAARPIARRPVPWLVAVLAVLALSGGLALSAAAGPDWRPLGRPGPLPLSSGAPPVAR